MLELTPDELLTTTRAVRRRLDLGRPVDRGLVEECLAIALQAPTGGNRQIWSFVIVTDRERRAALGDIYRRGFRRYVAEGINDSLSAPPPPTDAQRRIARSARYLSEHMGDVPVLVVPCVRGRTDDKDTVAQASAFGSILPATWSFMLAARARGLGTAWTSVHLFHEREAADLLGIPYGEVMQVALIPVAHTVGEGFRPGARRRLEEVAHWDGW